MVAAVVVVRPMMPTFQPLNSRIKIGRIRSFRNRSRLASIFAGGDLIFLGCQDRPGYESEAPQELWYPDECVDLVAGETTTTNPLSAVLDLYLTCEEVEEMWQHFSEGREAWACHLYVDGPLLIRFEHYEDYSREMRSCASMSFPVAFWNEYGPGPDLIPVSDLD